VVAAPLAEPIVISKNRYLSFVPGSPEEQTAIRVTLSDLSGFPAFSGQTRWVGPPDVYTDEGKGDFVAAALQCDPHFRDWGDIAELHVYGAEIVPQSAYAIHMTHEACSGSFDDAARYSGELAIATGHWGDVVAPFAGAGGAAQPDFGDIAALVDKFTANPSAPIKAVAQLQPNAADPSQAISFTDISNAVDAFTGGAYPYPGPADCP